MTTTVNTEQSEPRPFIVWDTCEIAQNHVESLKEEDPELDEDQAFSDACADSWLYESEWDYITEFLTEKMKEINPDDRNWYCEAAGMGWRKRNGHKTFHATTGQELLRAILPDTECTFQIYLKQNESDGEKYLYIVNSHHDAMGEVYEIYLEGTAPCGCGVSDCDPDDYYDEENEQDQRYCRYCNQNLPEGYEVED